MSRSSSLLLLAYFCVNPSGYLDCPLASFPDSPSSEGSVLSIGSDKSSGKSTTVSPILTFCVGLESCVPSFGCSKSVLPIKLILFSFFLCSCYTRYLSHIAHSFIVYSSLKHIPLSLSCHLQPYLFVSKVAVSYYCLEGNTLCRISKFIQYIRKHNRLVKRSLHPVWSILNAIENAS